MSRSSRDTPGTHSSWPRNHRTRTGVAAWDRNVRLGVDEADDARRLTTDGGLGNHSPAGVKLRGCERHHGQ